MAEETPYDWLVMIFMVGDNGLADEGVWAVRELYRVGLGDRTALGVQFRSRANGTLQFDVRRDLGPSGDGDDSDNRLHSRGEELLEENPAVALRKFLESFSKSYPARHRLLILSGHAEGAVGRKILGSRHGNLDPKSINEALEGIDGKIDVLGMDSCAMGTAEVGYELSGKVDRLAAAEGFEPDTGWPYYRILELLKKNPSIEPRDLAKQIVDGYALYYSDYTLAGASVDLSSCSLSQSKALAEAVRLLREKLTEGLNSPELQERMVFAHWRAQSYRREHYVDLYDFCDILEASHNMSGLQGGPEVVNACKKVKEVLKDGESLPYVECSNFAGAAFQYSNGVSIYFPWADFDAINYRPLAFSEATGWGDFISKYVEKTRRLVRSREKPGLQRPGQSGEAGLGFRDNPALNTRFFPELASPVKNPPIKFDSGQPAARLKRSKQAGRAGYTVDGD